MELEQTNETKFKLVIPNFKSVKTDLNKCCEYVPDYIYLYFNTFKDAEAYINNMQEHIKKKCFVVSV
jgi:hypothetical protein